MIGVNITCTSTHSQPGRSGKHSLWLGYRELGPLCRDISAPGLFKLHTGMENWAQHGEYVLGASIVIQPCLLPHLYTVFRWRANGRRHLLGRNVHVFCPILPDRQLSGALLPR